MKATEVREMSSKEILERIATEKEELVKMKLNHTVSPLDNPMLIKKSRRNIARLNTILAQKRSEQVTQANHGKEILEKRESGSLSAIRWRNL